MTSKVAFPNLSTANDSKIFSSNAETTLKSHTRVLPKANRSAKDLNERRKRSLRWLTKRTMIVNTTIKIIAITVKSLKSSITRTLIKLFKR